MWRIAVTIASRSSPSEAPGNAMVSWAEFAAADPELASCARTWFEDFEIAFLATVRRDGGPRVHPVSPFLQEGFLYVAILADSPKRHDLRRDGRYALHALPGEDYSEFVIRGRAVEVTDAGVQKAVLASSLFSKGDEILFRFDIEQADSTVWESVNQPHIRRPIRGRWRGDRA